MFMRLLTIPCGSSVYLYETQAVTGIRAAKSNKRKDMDAKPPRITSNVKQSLRILKKLREFEQKKAVMPKPSTRYCRKKETKEQLSRDNDLCEGPTHIYNTNGIIEVGVPVLLVDGYNVCGYWSKLKKYFAKGKLAVAREMLADELIWFSEIRGIKVVVVYDAMKSGFPTRKEIFENIDIVYTGSSCADAWIEREVDALKKDGCPDVTVVTSDFLQQQIANGSGAYVWNCKDLISEINDAKIEYEEILLEQRPYDMQPKVIESDLPSDALSGNLPPDALSSLKELKRNLEEKARQEKRR